MNSNLPKNQNQKRKKLGQLGERLAKIHLQDKGYNFLCENFHSRFGEIDLIFLDKNTIVFVEVKTRTGTNFGRPEESISFWKIRSIIKTSQYFSLLNPSLPQSARIDVVAVQFDEVTEKLVYIKHYQNITL